MYLTAHRRTLHLLGLVVLLLIGDRTAWAVGTADWYPMAVGNNWTYQDTSTGASYTETVAAINVLVNGALTAKLVDSNGAVSYESHNANGHRLHQLLINEYIPELGQYINITTNFQPAVLTIPAQINLGQAVTSTGTVSMTMTGYGTYPLNYSITTTVLNQETLQIRNSPASTYKTRYQITINGVVDGQYVTTTETSTAWFQPGVGPVKWYTNVDGFVDESILIATNVGPIPVPVTPDLRATQSIVPRHGVIGDNFQITAHATNNGPGDATNVQIQATLPAGMQYLGMAANNASCSSIGGRILCQWATLAVGQTETIQLNFNAPSVGSYTSAIGLTGDQTDPDTSNNSDTQVIYVNLPSIHTGDISPPDNPDGRVSIGDALQALRYALGLDSLPDNARQQLADVSPMDKGQPIPDGKLTIGDALAILRKALGLQNF